MKSNNKFLNRILRIKYFPILLLFLALLTYGALIPTLGFYWDDFPYSWFAHIGGASGVFRAVAADRPVLGILYGIIVPFLGENPLAWQLFAILTHWLWALCIFFLIRTIWPEKDKEAVLITMLFLVYPGFSQQWISVIYSQVFLLFSIYFLSILLMVFTIREKRRYWLLTILSLALSLFSMAALEYTIGLELLRPIIILLVLNSTSPSLDIRKKMWVSLKRWVPYLLGLILFGIYRIFLASSVLYSVRITDDLVHNPFGLFIQFIQASFNNLLNAGFAAWIKPFSSLANINFTHWTDKLFLGITLTSAVLIFAYIHFSQINGKEKSTPNEIKWAIWAILLGSIAIFFSGLPFFAVRYELILSFPYDRLSLPMIFGSALIIFGLSVVILRNKLIWNVFFSLLIGFSIGTQFLNANAYREDWDNLREFFWQMRWRIPDMEKGTMLLTDNLPLEHYSDNSLSAPLNWMYTDSIVNNEMPYILNFTSVRLGNRVPNLEAGTPINQYYRIVNFVGNTSDSLVIQFSPPGCLHILDPELDEFNPNVSSALSKAIQLTNFSRILDTPKKAIDSSLAIFGEEPFHNWCYYYEKAALAQQNGEWKIISDLGKTAFSINDYPNDAIERFPFIEAYAHLDDFTHSVQLTRKTLEISPAYSKMLCALWSRIFNTRNSMPFPEEINVFLTNELQCAMP
jgi:hypothetical protein